MNMWQPVYLSLCGAIRAKHLKFSRSKCRQCYELPQEVRPCVWHHKAKAQADLTDAHGLTVKSAMIAAGAILAMAEMHGTATGL